MNCPHCGQNLELPPNTTDLLAIAKKLINSANGWKKNVTKELFAWRQFERGGRA